MVLFIPTKFGVDVPISVLLFSVPLSVDDKSLITKTEKEDADKNQLGSMHAEMIVSASTPLPAFVNSIGFLPTSYKIRL